MAFDTDAKEKLSKKALSGAFKSKADRNPSPLSAPFLQVAGKALELAKSLCRYMLQVEAVGATGAGEAAFAIAGSALISVLRTSTRLRG